MLSCDHINRFSSLGWSRAALKNLKYGGYVFISMEAKYVVFITPDGGKARDTSHAIVEYFCCSVYLYSRIMLLKERYMLFIHGNPNLLYRVTHLISMRAKRCVKIMFYFQVKRIYGLSKAYFRIFKA